MGKMIRELLKIFRNFRRLILSPRVFIIDTSLDDAQPPAQVRRDFFFGPTGVKIDRIHTRSLKPLLYHGPVLVRGAKKIETPVLVRIANRVLDVDEKRCFNEAWNWHIGLEHLLGAADVSHAKAIYDNWQSLLPSDLQRAYIFGTGPSLARAIERDWSDGIRIVCNTIVRDADLWHHIAPHAIVAGDALYHFGLTEFAKTFRRDLRLRLAESPDTIFIYPAMFDTLVRREFGAFLNRLVPIPSGKSTLIHKSLAQDFQLPDLGNVLNLLLLPVACSLRRNIGLWGFDGRAPADTFFWSNSGKHSYPELIEGLRTASPAFFDEMVPKDDPEKYIRSVHGDVLAHGLKMAQADGYTFEMLHKTWTPALARYSHIQESAKDHA
jgi:hypothetical protein